MQNLYNYRYYAKDSIAPFSSDDVTFIFRERDFHTLKISLYLVFHYSEEWLLVTIL